MGLAGPHNSARGWSMRMRCARLSMPGRRRMGEELASFSCDASSSRTVAMEAREMVTSEYRHMQPMKAPPPPRPYFQLAFLISSARFRMASRSALAAFFSACRSGSLLGFAPFCLLDIFFCVRLCYLQVTLQKHAED